MLYEDDHSISKVRRIMKILKYLHFRPASSILKTKIQALNNEELSSVTSLLAFGEILWRTYRSSHPDGFCKNSGLKNFVFSKCISRTLYFCEFCEIFKNIFFTEHLRWLHLNVSEFAYLHLRWLNVSKAIDKFIEMRQVLTNL